MSYQTAGPVAPGYSVPISRPIFTSAVPAADNDDYPLPRVSEESQRLDVQGDIWSKNLGYYVHPAIGRNLTAESRIADVGCGTGGFLVTLAELNPSSNYFDGFDISPEQFRRLLPRNVALHTADARHRFHAHFRGQFDFVHLRGMVTAFRKEDWPVVTRNVIELLKPGGGIQWEEGEFPSVRRFRGKDPLSSGQHLALCTATMTAALEERLQHGWRELPDLFAQLGLINVTRDTVASDRLPHTRTPLAQVTSEAVWGWARQMEGLGRRVWEPERLRELEELVRDEVSRGAYVRYDIHVAIGFRPAY